jgi:hypothetical protein
MKNLRFSTIAICTVLVFSACGQKKQIAAVTEAASVVEPAVKPLVRLAKVVEEPMPAMNPGMGGMDGMM